MLMALGLFVFELTSAPFESLRRSVAQRWTAKDRVGQGPAYQWTGPGEDAITLDGTLAPELTGGPATLDTLRGMAATGKAWILVSGSGAVLGAWIIAQIDQTSTHLRGDGSARKISFSLSLKRYWDDDPTVLGDLMISLPSGHNV